MLQKIHLEKIKVYAYHGCMEAEQKVGNNFEIDVTLTVDAQKAMQSDNLDHTLNYVEIYDIIKSEMQVKSRLLENVAYRITTKIREKFDNNVLKSGTLKISKMHPPIGEIEKVSFEMDF